VGTDATANPNDTFAIVYNRATTTSRIHYHVWDKNGNATDLYAAVVKNHVARNSDFTMKNLFDQLGAGFTKVTGKTCTRIVSRIKKIEHNSWTEDLNFDEIHFCEEHINSSASAYSL
jgi:hypothetical protein